MNLVTPTQFARLVPGGVTSTRVRQWIASGALPAQKFGRNYLLDPRHVKRVAKRSKAGWPKGKRRGPKTASGTAGAAE